MLRSECFEGHMFWATILFWAGVAVFGFVTAREHKLGLKDTLLVLVGAKRVYWSGISLALYIAVFVVSFGVIFWGMEVCKGTS